MADISNINYKPVGAKNMTGETFSRFSEAPARIYTYSINDKLNEKDEFRRSIKQELKAEKENQEKNNILKKVLLIGSAIAAFIVLERKKII